MQSQGHPQLQGSIRPGCVHLALDALFDGKEWPGHEEVSNKIASGIAEDVRARILGRPWSNHDTDIFLHDKILKVREAAPLPQAGLEVGTSGCPCSLLIFFC